MLLKVLKGLEGFLSLSRATPVFSTTKRYFKRPAQLKRPLYEDAAMLKNKQLIWEAFPEMRQMVQKLPEYKEIPEAIDRAITAAEYVSHGGKMWRSTGVLCAYEAAASPEDLTPEKRRQAALIAAGAEILNGVILHLDDIEDKEPVRRYAPSFYFLPGKTLNATGELFAAESIRNLILTFCKNHPSYRTIFELYNRNGLLTYVGQVYDSLFYEKVTKKPIFDMYTYENFKLMCKYKTTIYTLAMGSEVGLAVANKYDKEKFLENYHIFDYLGEYFQMVNDCKDIFRNQGEVLKSDEVTLGHDISTGKFTWFAARALERATPVQKKLFLDNYGREDPECVMKIFNLYEDLRLDELFQEEENGIIRKVQEEIANISNGIPREIYYDVASKSFRADLNTL